MTFAIMLWESAEVQGGTKARGPPLSYLMVFSIFAPFRPPIACVLITSKHSGLVQPVEFIEYL